MRRHATIAAVFLASLLGACGQDPREEDAAREAFAAFLDALSRADGKALWDLSDETTKRHFEDLVADLKDAVSLVDRYYPESDRARARKNLLADVLGPSSTGEHLFLHLLDTASLRAPEDPAARTIERVVVGAHTVRVVTQSGDTVEFTREPDGKCRTGLLLKAFVEVPGVTTLRENVATVRQNRDIIERTPPAREGQAANGGQR